MLCIPARKIWLGLMSLMFATAAAMAQPANDNFANALVITNAAGSVTNDNLAATLEAGEPRHNCVNNDPGGASVWYKWTAPGDGLATFTTVGSDFDTVLAIYTGNSGWQSGACCLRR